MCVSHIHCSMQLPKYRWSEEQHTTKPFLIIPPLGVKVCANGSSPTCENGSAPIRDQNRSTPPCPGQGVGRAGKANTCADGSAPVKVRGQKKNKGRKQGRCARPEKICCDGSSPSFDRNKNTPQCGNGERAQCSQVMCNGP